MSPMSELSQLLRETLLQERKRFNFTLTQTLNDLCHLPKKKNCHENLINLSHIQSADDQSQADVFRLSAAVVLPRGRLAVAATA